MHGHIRSPEHEIMNKKSQGIEKINQDQLPVFPEVFKYSPVFLTVIRKELMDLRPFQYCCEEESHRQRQKHTVRDADFAYITQEERQ